MELQDLISRVPEQIKKGFIHRRHKKGSSIILQGEENNYLYVLVSGSADVILQSFSGAVVTLYTYQAYSCFGELELFNKSTKTFDIISRTNCETISVHGNSVFEWMQLDFEFTKYLIEQLTEKLLKSSHTLINLSLLNVKDRFLNNLYTHYLIGDLSLLSKQMVCAETCIPLRSLNRTLLECKAEGFIDFRKKQFHILTVSKLEEYCKSLL